MGGFAGTTGDPRGVDAKWIKGAHKDHPWQKVFYVGSAHPNASDADANHGLNPDYPLKTLARALALAQAGTLATSYPGRTTKILIGPEHTENIATTMTISQKGLIVEGIGVERERPKFSFITSTAAHVLLSGNDAQIKNVQFECNIDAQTKMIRMTGLGQHIDAIHLMNGTGQPVTGILIDGAVNAILTGIVTEMDVAGAAEAIQINATSDLIFIGNCVLRGDFSDAVIDVPGAATRLHIVDNYLMNLNTTANDGIKTANAAITGWIGRNIIGNNTDANTDWVVFGGASVALQLGENYGVNNKQETGKLIGTVSV